MSTCSNFKFYISNLLCSAGTFEDWRPDASQFKAADKGASNGWPGEAWIDTRSNNVRTIMAAVSDGCVHTPMHTWWVIWGGDRLSQCRWM